MHEKIHGCRTTFHAYPDIYGADPESSKSKPDSKTQTLTMGLFASF